jgi:hypothetical protein
MDDSLAHNKTRNEPKSCGHDRSFSIFACSREERLSVVGTRFPKVEEKRDGEGDEHIQILAGGFLD